MAALQDELKRIIDELCTDTFVRTELLRCIITKKGIVLSEPQLGAIVEAISTKDGSDSIEVDIEGITQKISIGPEDIDYAILEFEDKLGSKTERAISLALEHMAPDILKSLYDALPKALQERRQNQSDFEYRLHKRWQAGLDRLEMLIIMAHESGDTYSEDLQCEIGSEAVSQESILIHVLMALHCRACRTAREILCLLKSGYADGANARWRSLHEIAVTATFLVQHRGDSPQRYFDHAAVECWRSAKLYQQHCESLGYEPFSDKEFAEIQMASDDAISKYGEPFGGDYGWAANALGIQRPTFHHIEANLDMSQWRPFFRLACQSVHASSHGLHFSLAIPEGAEVARLAGASNAGLADPGHCTAISLTMTSATLLTVRPNLDSLVACKCMNILVEDIGQHFLKCSDDLERDM